MSNVKLQENPGAASFSYYNGNDPNGSYAYTDGHGSGYVFIDYSQAGVYDNTRIAAN